VTKHNQPLVELSGVLHPTPTTRSRSGRHDRVIHPSPDYWTDPITGRTAGNRCAWTWFTAGVLSLESAAVSRDSR
jgi:hypothetical protein